MSYNMIIVLHGEDSFRSAQKLAELKEKFFKEVDKTQTNVFLIDEKTEKEEARLFFNTSSLLARKKLIIIPDFSIIKKETKNFIQDLIQENKIGENVILIVRSLTFLSSQDFPLHKTKFVEEFKILKSWQLEKYLLSLCQKRNIKIESQALKALIFITQGNLWQINQELDKLQAFAYGRKITQKDIYACVKGVFEEEIFNFLDALAKKNKEKALLFLEKQIKQGESPFYLVNRLASHLKIILAIKYLFEQGKNKEQVRRITNLHPFLIEKILDILPYWSKTKLKELFQKLLEIEYQGKIGQGEVTSQLTLLLFSL